MNSHQRRKERRRIARWCQNQAEWSRWYAANGQPMAALGAAVSAVDTLGAVRTYLPGRRVAWWARGGRPPEDMWGAIGRGTALRRDLLGPDWRERFAVELGVRL